jgi:glycosyltransferase involved in cell wall biosynthesis
MVVGILAEGLVERGIDVTLFASGDSRTSAALDAVFAVAPSHHIGQVDWELDHVLQCVARADEFDVVHDHTGPLALALLGLAGAPVVHTVHGPLTGSRGSLYARACNLTTGVGLASLSLNQRRPRPDLPWVGNVPNAIDLAKYPWREDKEDFLLFLGRMSEDKGAHHAVEVARAAGMPLRIAAKCREEDEFAYFEKMIAPVLGSDVDWLGEVAHEQKVELLSRARALLFPIDWEEPFGLVMIEALACGTPVVATRRGSVSEVIGHGRTGFVVDDHREMPSALARLSELDPAAIRAEAEIRFSPTRLVEDYLAVYEKVRRLRARSQVDEGERLARHVHRHIQHRHLADRPTGTAVMGVSVEDDIRPVRTDRAGQAARAQKRPDRLRLADERGGHR